MTVDVSPVLDRKKRALEAYPSQVAVNGDSFALSDGKTQTIQTKERFRRLGAEQERALPFRQQSRGSQILTALVAAIIGLSSGALLTVYHQSTVAIAGTAVPAGLIAAIALLLLLEVGLRLAFQTRIVAGIAAVGAIVSVGLLSIQSMGGTVLIQSTGVGITWSVAPVVVAIVALAWPQPHRRPTTKIATQDIAKGSSLQ